MKLNKKQSMATEIIKAIKNGKQIVYIGGMRSGRTSLMNEIKKYGWPDKIKTA